MKDSPFERAKARLREQDRQLLQKQRDRVLRERMKNRESEILVAEDRSHSSLRTFALLGAALSSEVILLK